MRLTKWCQHRDTRFRICQFKVILLPFIIGELYIWNCTFNIWISIDHDVIFKHIWMHAFCHIWTENKKWYTYIPDNIFKFMFRVFCSKSYQVIKNVWRRLVSVKSPALPWCLALYWIYIFGSYVTRSYIYLLSTMPARPVAVRMPLCSGDIMSGLTMPGSLCSVIM